MLIRTVCPYCGTILNFDNTMSYMICHRCGSRITMSQQNPAVQQNVSGLVPTQPGASVNPNLIISYMSISPTVGLVVRIVSTGERRYCISGQTMSFQLLPGNHRIILKIGKKNYARDIYVPAYNAPVRISAGWNGRGQITVDQPSPFPAGR